jgi:hypothetical protein
VEKRLYEEINFLICEFILFGFLEEGLLGATSDDDLPDFLLPDDSSKIRKLPGYLRSGSAPKIFKSSLKDYHGLEGVRL